MQTSLWLISMRMLMQSSCSRWLTGSRSSSRSLTAGRVSRVPGLSRAVSCIESYEWLWSISDYIMLPVVSMYKVPEIPKHASLNVFRKSQSRPLSIHHIISSGHPSRMHAQRLLVVFPV